jgi:hypothetical protein
MLTGEIFTFHGIRVEFVKPELLYRREHILGTDLRKLVPARKLNGALSTVFEIDATVNTAMTQTVDFDEGKKNIENESRLL